MTAAVQRTASKGPPAAQAKRRLFIAVDLPGHVHDALALWQEWLKRNDWPVRWVTPANIHLTVKFLGDVFAHRQTDIERCLAKVAGRHASFDLKVASLGLFPGVRKPRVIWAGMAGATKMLVNFQRQLDLALVDIGFAAEKRAFKGHLTLGRFRKNVSAEALRHVMEKAAQRSSVSFQAKHVTLYQSRLQPSGAVYTPLFQASFAHTDRNRREP